MRFKITKNQSICSRIRINNEKYSIAGIKANFETSGVDSSVLLNDCEAALDESNHAESIIKWAQDAGKSTGVVTTTR